MNSAARRDPRPQMRVPGSFWPNRLPTAFHARHAIEIATPAGSDWPELRVPAFYTLREARFLIEAYC